MGVVGIDAGERHTRSIPCSELLWPRVSLHRAGQTEGGVMGSGVPGTDLVPLSGHQLNDDILTIVN